MVGKWPSEGERLLWPLASMSHPLLHPLTPESTQVEASGKVTPVPALPIWTCFPSWLLKTTLHSQEEKLKGRVTVLVTAT